MARTVLAGHALGSCLHSDILAWLPDRARERMAGLDSAKLRAAVFDGRFKLDLTGRTAERYFFGDCHIAGPPCVEFSPMGAGRREGGASMLCLYVWARALREQAPMLVIIENVPRFPIALLTSLFGDMYLLDHVIVDAKDFQSPARRRRLYVVMTLRGKLCLAQPLSNLAAALRTSLPDKLSWELLFCLEGADDGFSVPVSKRAREYLRVFGDRHGVYDLDQLPRGRPRYTQANCPLFGLTAHTRNVWSPAANRCLRRGELAAAMGIPCHPALAASYGIAPLSFDHFSRSAAARLIGNGMSVPCVGSIMIWCAAFCVSPALDVPRNLGVLPAGGSVDNVAIDSSEMYCDSTPTIADIPAPVDHVSASTSLSTWRVLAALGTALCDHSMFVDIAAFLRSPIRPLERMRELFPLPAIAADTVATYGGVAAQEVDCACEYLLGVIVGLNWLCGFRDRNVAVGNTTAAQRAANGVVVAAALDLHSRLVVSFDSRVDGEWRNFEDKGEAPCLKLIASAVAVPDCAATCDPASLIRGELGSAISDAKTIFPCPPPGLDSFPTFHSGSRWEYMALTVRQLRAGLLHLAGSCKGGASVFPVGKAGGKQRVVWNGTRISLAAPRPPPPVHLADPCSFGLLDIPAGVQLRVTKRDCKTWFDRLAVHRDIGDFFGRPRVGQSELLDHGFTCADILALGGLDGLDSFVPCSKVWPMGFSWSSCVAQSTLLSICEESGLCDRHVLACDSPLPSSLSLAFAVATDDLMIFSDAGAGITVAAAKGVEEVMLARGIVKNPDKDVDDTLSTTCVGVDLVDGRYWCTPGSRLWSLLDALLDLIGHGVGSRGAVASYLGSAQWFDLLRRLQLSVFYHIYGFCSGALARDWTRQTIPSEVLGELLLDMVLALVGKVDMQLPFLPIIAATDASLEYGHGGVVAQASIDDVRKIARMACKSGGHVCVGDGPELPAELAARLGPRYDLSLELRDFDVVFSVQVESPNHINIEEGVAVIRYLRWVLRSTQRFRHRVVLLVDSKVALGAIAKGRSSSKPLNALVRRAAALCFAGGLVLHCVFIPTKHNPADWPSRGDSTTWPAALRKRQYKKVRPIVCPGCGVFAKSPAAPPQAADRKTRFFRQLLY